MLSTLTASFALTALLIELTPGPNMVWLTMLSARYGQRAGFAATLGIALGLSLLALVALTGLARLVADYPVLFRAICLAGVAFMVWLAWDAWREPSRRGRWVRGAQDDPAKFFRRGLIINVLNLKAALFFITVMPNFVDFDNGLVPQYTVLSVIYVAIATIIHVLLVLGGEHLGTVVARKAEEKTVRLFSALALLAVAGWMLAKVW
ncbi:LysE family translocator [Aurantiacibacter sp. MUD11]|uniref:LysE family translocator n=1 Tax=Aurantiacibacter sp. MUD11 TaxID=3003265 RepID=UPI0022AAAE17|nr:LysE family translocator [Aurantiacibacter sp. MUD11]WAT18147.1 LysE family translocator [Aurantiacibacter sp. MUD11]